MAAAPWAKRSQKFCYRANPIGIYPWFGTVWRGKLKGYRIEAVLMDLVQCNVRPAGARLHARISRFQERMEAASAGR